MIVVSISTFSTVPSTPPPPCARESSPVCECVPGPSRMQQQRARYVCSDCAPLLISLFDKVRDTAVPSL